MNVITDPLFHQHTKENEIKISKLFSSEKLQSLALKQSILSCTKEGKYFKGFISHFLNIYEDFFKIRLQFRI